MKTKKRLEKSNRLSVEMKGFEPPTLWSQTRCASQLRYISLVLYCIAKLVFFFKLSKRLDAFLRNIAEKRHFLFVTGLTSRP